MFFSSYRLQLKQVQLFSVLVFKIKITERGYIWYTMYHVSTHTLTRVGQSTCMTVSQRLNQMGEEQFPRKKNNVVNIRRYGNGCWLNNNKMYPAQCFLIRVASLALAGSPTFWFLLRSLTSIVTAFTWKSLQWTRHLGHSNTTSFLYSCSPRDCKQVSTISNL